MAEKIIFSLSRVSKKTPMGKLILNDISLSFYYGAKIGVIGINGAGKSSLLKIIAGLDNEIEGEMIREKNITFGYLPQEPQLDPKLNVIDNIKAGLKETTDLLDRFNLLSDKMTESLSEDEMNKVIEEMGEVQEKIDKAGAWDLDRTLEVAMSALRVPPKDSDITKLSGGEKRRVSLCKLLLESPDVIILDEPTNHLDAESVAWLEDFLMKFKGTVITVTHDRYFLDHVASWILELDRGEGYPFKGNYSEWLKQKLERDEQEKKLDNKRKKTLKRELEWIRKTTKGRQAKSKARINAYENLLSQDNNKRADELEINIPTPPRLGDQVIEFHKVNKGFSDRQLIKDFSATIPRGAIVGIIGPNGVGKTTLFKMITDNENLDSGEITVGKTVEIAYVDQFRDNLANEKNVWEVISDGEEEMDLGFRKMHSRAYVGSFGFKGPDQQKKVGSLSGGERNRVHLAKLLKSGGNVLLLDEPTNDLDVGTLRALEEALLGFEGCVLVISHDRYFLDRVCTHIISFEKDELFFYTGNFSEYEEFKANQK